MCARWRSAPRGAPVAHVCAASGDDGSGDGSAGAPYATPLGALLAAGTDAVTVLVRRDGEYQPITKKAMKKKEKVKKRKMLKAAAAADRSDAAVKAAEELRAARQAAAAKIVITEDASLPAARRIRVRDGTAARGTRVKVMGEPSLES